MKPTLEQWKRIAFFMRDIYEGECGCYASPPETEGDILALEEFVAGLEADAKKQWATGAEIHDFWDHGWPGDNYYHDDSETPVLDESGNFILVDGESYNLDTLGYICPNGGGDGGERTFAEVFLEWKASKK